jgi:hypothetical protein
MSVVWVVETEPNWVGWCGFLLGIGLEWVLSLRITGSGTSHDELRRTEARLARLLLPPFTASLRYFSVLFDSLHECLPADSAERLAIERDHLGVEISDRFWFVN